MEIIEYFTCDNQDHWLSEIKKSDWEAAQLLYELLSKGTFKDTVGAASLVFLLTDGDSLVSFCTFSTFDDVQPTDLTPWIGFVYTFPEYRGHHYVGRLIEHIENIATAMEKEYIYISTDKDGLYEKYGYDFFKFLKDIHGEDSRIYRKKLSADDGTKEERKTLGAVAKSKIIETAKASCLDMTAPCGFSCNHCFLGQWCGGCRSSFCICSYATVCAHGNCTNFICSRDKNLDGCWECTEIETCKKGFYGLEAKDANVCKSNALFIKKHGKELHQKALTNLHKFHTLDEMQEVLPGDIKENIKFLEGYMNKD